MTSDDIDTWGVINSQFIGVHSKYDISFALNNVPEVQDSCKATKITNEMSYGNGPWQALPCVTLTPQQTVYGF